MYSSGKGPLGAQWETLPAKLLWAWNTSCVGLCSHSSQETISKILRRCVFHFSRNWLLFKVAIPFYTLPVVWSPVCSTFSPAFGAVSFTCGLIYSSTDIRHLFIHLLLYSVPFLMKLTIQTFCLLDCLLFSPSLFISLCSLLWLQIYNFSASTSQILLLTDISQYVQLHFLDYFPVTECGFSMDTSCTFSSSS